MRCSVVLVLLALSAVSAQRDGYTYVCANLNKYQVTNGGFKPRENEESVGDLESTADAALLVALYNLNDKISTTGVSNFIESLQNGDGGFGKAAGEASDAASTRAAVFSLANLELEVPDSEATATYLRSLFDEATGLFAPSAGAPGDIQATFNVLNALDILGALDSVEPLKGAILATLKKAAASDHFTFEDDSLGKLNYFGVIVGSYVGYDFGGQKQPWIRYIKGLAAETGGFSQYKEGRVSYEYSAQAAHALYTLGGPSVVYSDSLVRYARSTPRILTQAGKAHLVVLAAGSTHQYRLEPTLERADGTPLGKGSVIVQGVTFRSVVHLENVNNVMRSATVKAHVQFDETTTSSELRFSGDRRSYVSVDLFDTEDKLGPIIFTFVAVQKIAGYPDLVVTETRKMSIGFGINVVSAARVEATGRDISEGETVATGTKFSFDVSLFRADRKHFTAGSFDVNMLVLDSSQVLLARQSLNAAKATELKFAWTLEDLNLPPGQLVFRFEVTTGGKAAHTVHDVSYTLNTPAVASQIVFEGFSRDKAPVYKLGEQVVVSFVPASFPERRAVHAFRAKDVNGVSILEKRQFFLDLRSGSLSAPPTQSIKGSVVGGKYQFTLDLKPRFEAIGTHFVSFRYTSAQEKDFALQPYDSFFSEVLEDASSLNYTVNAELHFTDVETKPEEQSLYYGDDLTFVFKVKDSISNSYIQAVEDDYGTARVSLALQHPDPVRDTPFTSATAEAVVSATDQFTIQYKITPNAVRGPGALVISARGSNIAEIPLLGDDGQPVRFDINIGGDIEVDSSTFATDNPDASETAIAARFTLRCKENTLDNALLSANLIAPDGSVLARDLQVGSFLDHYEVSYVTAHKNAIEGRYTLEFFRETDKKRVSEGLEFYERKLKQGNVGKLEKPTLSPLFTIQVNHDGVGISDFPVSPELVLVSSLLGLFVYSWWFAPAL